VAAPKLSPQHAALGLVIRRLREERELSQMDLADETELHRNYIGGVERGEINASFANILKLASIFGIRPSDLLRMAEEAVGSGSPAATDAGRPRV
jgi:transcriptional regulator with XRE-family HTH domain